jgi:hypothetical protein
LLFSQFYNITTGKEIRCGIAEVWDKVVISITAIKFTLNSCSKKLRRLNSHDNSKAVKIGSLEDKAIKLGLARALEG